jgi:uncharacterized protein (TIGR00255 family)
MTGFSSKTVILPSKSGEEVSFAVEIKSLNSRFFEAVCKLPSSLNSLEIPIVNSLKEKLMRGRVFISVKVSGEGAAFEKVEPVIKIIDDYLKATKKIKRKLKISGDLSMSDVIALPNAFSFEREEISKTVEKKILMVIGDAIDSLIACRLSEGKCLQKDLEKRFLVSQKCMDKIKKHFDASMKKKKDEIKKMLMLVQKGDQEAETHLGECYESIDKIDIHEEIIRFNSHLKVARKLLKEKAPEKGKRFEFTLQELGREINTISAKCSNFDISSIAVDIKVELEKVREQIQNIV